MDKRFEKFAHMTLGELLQHRERIVVLLTEAVATELVTAEEREIREAKEANKESKQQPLGSRKTN